MNDKKVIVIPFTLPWDRPADFQRQTCLELSKRYKVIAYMQRDADFFLKFYSQKKIHRYPAHANLSFYTPRYFLPFRRIPIIEKMNQVLAFIIFQAGIPRDQRITLWIFDPVFYLLPRVSRGISLYDCVDFHAGFQTGTGKTEVVKQENMLIESVGFFFVNSRALFDAHKQKRHAHLVPAGFRLREFMKRRDFPLHGGNKKPVLGYVGSIDERLDYPLLLSLVRRNPHWEFEFWGPVQSAAFNAVASFKNVRHNLCAPKEIPAVIRRFTVGMIPYRLDHQGARYSYPMKIFEYFYIGIPVISSPIQELARFPEFVQVGQSVKDWESAIHRVLSQEHAVTDKRAQRRLAVANSWEKKIDTIVGIISGKVADTTAGYL